MQWLVWDKKDRSYGKPANFHISMRLLLEMKDAYPSKGYWVAPEHGLWAIRFQFTDGHYLEIREV